MGIRIQIYFASGEGPHAPEGLGWYLLATDDSLDQTVEIIPRVRLSPREVENLSRTVSKLAEGKPLNWAGGNWGRAEQSLPHNVTIQNQRAQEIAEREIADAERAIANLNILKARRAEFEQSNEGAV